MLCNDRSMNLERFCCNSGKDTKPTYHTKINKKGQIELEIVGYESLQDKIEAARLGTELSVLVSRYENGDLLALNSRPGFYADVTKFPANVIDAMNIVIDAQDEFSKLPVDIKKQYDSDWKKWLAEFGNPEWLKVMKPIYNPDKEVKESGDKNVQE